MKVEVLKNWFKYLVSFLVVVVFILSTSGFTIYSHHCSINGTSYSISLLSSFSNCNACGENQHESTKKSCCSVKKEIKKEVDDDNCCSNEELFVKIDTDYTFQTEKNNIEPVINKIIVLSLLTRDINLVPDTDTKINNYSLPPPKTGVDIITFLSQQKTDPAPIS